MLAVLILQTDRCYPLLSQYKFGENRLNIAFVIFLTSKTLLLNSSRNFYFALIVRCKAFCPVCKTPSKTYKKFCDNRWAPKRLNGIQIAHIICQNRSLPLNFGAYHNFCWQSDHTDFWNSLIKAHFNHFLPYLYIT